MVIVPAWLFTSPRLGDRICSGGVLAGLALILGRRLPVYVSALMPLIMAGIFMYGTSQYWKNRFTPYLVWGEATREQLIAFALTEALVITIFLCPVIGVWLLGLDGRQKRAEGVAPVTEH
jgi:hypothetical protein